MTIRKATESDASAIARVHVDSWQTTYRGLVSDELIESLSYEQRHALWSSITRAPAEGHCVLVAEDDHGEIVGFLHGGPERSGDPDYLSELYAIYLLEEHQGKGMGRALISAFAQTLRLAGHSTMLVWVLKSNPACGFYRALGGHVLREKEDSRGHEILVEVAYGWKDITALL